MKLLTQRELAETLNVSTRTLTNWRKRKILPVLKVGKVVRYDLEKCRKALEAFETTTITSSS